MIGHGPGAAGARPLDDTAPSDHESAATFSWQSPDGSGGQIVVGVDGRPRIEFIPAMPSNDGTHVAPLHEYTFSASVVTGKPPAAGSGASKSASLYLELMKKCLTRIVFKESGPPIDPESSSFDEATRREGRDWPADAETMAGILRLNNVQQCVEDVLRRDVPGDLIETGVWRGGTTIFMRAILAAHGDTTRQVWVADSFQGLPKPDVARYPADEGWDHTHFSQLAVSLDQVKANFARYDLLDDRVQFLKGWFKDTLPHAPISRLAVMRLDGDLYESTMDALTALYPKLSPGGYVIIDDYGAINACRQAVHDFRNTHGIEDPIQEVDWTGAYWRRSQ
jgi:hypothetical protein